MPKIHSKNVILFSFLLVAIFTMVGLVISSQHKDRIKNVTESSKKTLEQKKSSSFSLETNNEALESPLSLMEVAYQTLQAKRALLKKKLSVLKAKLWGVSLPPEQARNLTEKMQQGYKALEMPLLLGGFQSTTEITVEKSRIDYLLKKLDALESILDKAKP